VPPDASNARKAVADAIDRLKKVVEHTHSVCGTWFMPQ
jgi:hypothetical protein